MNISLSLSSSLRGFRLTRHRPSGYVADRRAECGNPPCSAAAGRTTKEGRLVAAPSSASNVQPYGQADVRSTVFEVIGIPATVGVLSESAEVPVAVAE
jgi:hypothetical protein